jgi:hypothetical protein
MGTSARLRAVLPLAISIAVVAFIWTELALNLSFHWLTVQDGVFGAFGLPQSFMLVVPAAFVTWGWFFALGADAAALRKTLIASATGTLAAVIIMAVGPALADSPDFWGLAVAVGLAALGLVVLSALSSGDAFAPAPPFTCAGVVLLWWFATGLDGYAPAGKGPHTVEALTAALTAKPLSAGTGAFGGLLSMPWTWVAVGVFASFVCGGLLGVLSSRLAPISVRRSAAAAAATSRA